MPKVDTQRAFSSPRLVILFNEWMRRYTEQPESFQAQFRTVGEFLKEQDAGKEPSYGAVSAAYLATLEDDMEAAASTQAAAPSPAPAAAPRKKASSRKRRR